MTREEKVKKLLEVLHSQVGIAEFPAGSNNVKYNIWFYGREVYDGDKPGAFYPWCGTFVSWCFAQAGIPLPTIDYARGYAGCPYAVAHISKFGRLITKPEPGDIVFHDWNGDGKFDHTSIFIGDIGKGLFKSGEGNTSFKDNSNGGQVMERTDRCYKVAIFVRPHILDELVLS